MSGDEPTDIERQEHVSKLMTSKSVQSPNQASLSSLARGAIIVDSAVLPEPAAATAAGAYRIVNKLHVQMLQDQLSLDSATQRMESMIHYSVKRRPIVFKGPIVGYKSVQQSVDTDTINEINPMNSSISENDSDPPQDVRNSVSVQRPIVDPVLLEIFDPISLKLHVIDPRTILLPVQVHYRYGGFEAFIYFLRFRFLEFFGFSPWNAIKNKERTEQTLRSSNFAFYVFLVGFNVMIFIVTSVSSNGAWLASILIFLLISLWYEFVKANKGLTPGSLLFSNKPTVLEILQLIFLFVALLIIFVRTGYMADADSVSRTRHYHTDADDGLGVNETYQPTQAPTPTPTSTLGPYDDDDPDIKKTMFCARYPGDGSTVDYDDPYANPHVTCSDADKSMLYLSFIFYTLFLVIFAYRRYTQMKHARAAAKQNDPDADPCWWVRLTVTTPAYLWNTSSLWTRIFGAFIRNWGTEHIWFLASKYAIDELNDGLCRIACRGGGSQQTTLFGLHELTHAERLMAESSGHVLGGTAPLYSKNSRAGEHQKLESQSQHYAVQRDAEGKGVKSPERDDGDEQKRKMRKPSGRETPTSSTSPTSTRGGAKRKQIRKMAVSGPSGHFGSAI